MDINVTLFGEMITFAILVWVMMKYVWPPFMKMLEERQQKIADGLEAAERGQNDLKIAQESVKKQLRDAKQESSSILDNANKKAVEIIEEGKEEAGVERDKILTKAAQNIVVETNKAKESLQKQTAELVVAATEKILQEKVDGETQKKLVDTLIAKI